MQKNESLVKEINAAIIKTQGMLDKGLRTKRDIADILTTLQSAREALSWYKPYEKQPEELVLPEDRAGHGFSDIVLIWYEGTHARSIGYYCPKSGLWYDAVKGGQCNPALWAYLLPNPNPPTYEDEDEDEEESSSFVKTTEDK